MQIQYDQAGDILLIRLRQGKSAETDEVAPGIIVDFDENGLPLAIEILNAHRILTPEGTLLLELPLPTTNIQ